MHPILWRFPEAWPLVGGFPIRSFSVMVLLGVLAACWYLRGKLFRKGDPEDDRAFDHLLRNVLLLGFLGARLTYVAIHPGVVTSQPDLFSKAVALIAVWQGGIVSYGGFFGGALGAWLWARRHRLGMPALADVLAPALALAQVFGRIGCLLVGDDHGAPWDGPWAITFSGVPDSLIPPELVGVPLHPAQVYLSLMNLVIFSATAWLYPRRRFDGQVLCAVMGLYAVGRFTVEMTRGDDAARGIYGAFSTSQWWSLVTLAMAIALWLRWRRGPRTEPLGAAPA